ncbi:hypothetical protein [Streptomyces glaucus]|uniref:hypothetical protein n=1 Tax=Streptomyces glaucus TaxID=284029 RepID=UPI0031D2DACF
MDARVVRPAGGLVRTVTEGLAERIPELSPGPSAELPRLPGPPTLPGTPGSPGVPDLPGEPSVPALPDVPGAPELPELPDVPAAPAVPGHPLPTLVTPAPQPGSPAPQPGSPAPQPASPAVPSAGDGHTPDRRGGAVAGTDVHGPRADVVPEASAHGGAHRQRAASPSDHVPVHRAPAGEPDGALGNRSAADSGTSRHGDVQAVTPDHRAAPRFVPGTTVSADAAGIQDRYRDVPVSPA